jgi:hypothetical protein
MNDKDKEAFEKWLNDQNYKYDTWDGQDYRDGKIVSIYSETELAWQAVCEYKDKEIDEIKFTYKSLNDDALEIINENKKLREALKKIIEKDLTRIPCPDNKLGCLVLHYGNSDLGIIAKEALKEVGEE